MKKGWIFFLLIFSFSCACNKKTGDHQRVSDSRIKIIEQPTNCIDSSKINKEALCIMSYEPVCGCDGKTYSNGCMAENAGVTSFTKGECK